MRHFGLVCNLLVAIDGTPVLATPEVVPGYPGGLPGGVCPGLEIVLRRLSKDQAKVFMDIEYPQGGPIAIRAMAETFDSIGEFYAAILAAFQSDRSLAEGSAPAGACLSGSTRSGRWRR